MQMAQKHSVTPHSVQDRFNNLASKVKSKLSREQRESGGGDKKQSEMEKLVEELVTLSEESDKKAEDQSKAKKEVVVSDKRQAIESKFVCTVKKVKDCNS